MIDHLRNLKLSLAGPRRSGSGLLKEMIMKLGEEIRLKKYRDSNGNTYGVEKASNGNWVVIRTNSGGNRKACRQLETAGSQAAAQGVLDGAAEICGWTEVPQ